MTRITRASAFSNNEVAYLAWEIDDPAIPGCLGFNIVREFLDSAENVIEAKPLAAYVAFNGQHNPEGLPQNTTVWPVQKFNWRDLTLRKKRSKLERRDEKLRVRYCIRAVGRMRDGLEKVEVVPESHFDRKTKQEVLHTYEGDPIPLGYLTPAFRTNVMDVPRPHAVHLDLHQRHFVDAVHRAHPGRGRQDRVRRIGRAHEEAR
jgi:hypothetical protein